MRYIATELDEMEREDFVRLKKVVCLAEQFACLCVRASGGCYMTAWRADSTRLPSCYLECLPNSWMAQYLLQDCLRMCLYLFALET